MGLRSSASRIAVASTAKIDPTMLDSSSVSITNAPVAHDATNGWSLSSDNTAVVLNGTACAIWRLPASSQITFNFPCSAITF